MSDCKSFAKERRKLIGIISEQMLQECYVLPVFICLQMLPFCDDFQSVVSQ